MMWEWFQDFAFAQPGWLWLLLGIPVLAMVRGRRGKSEAVPFSSLHLVKQLGKLRRRRFGLVASVLFLAGLVAGVLGLARPQKIHATEEVKASGVEIILSIDVSLSMQIKDFRIGGERVNRLEAAKKVMREFVEGRPNDRIGLVAFAGRPYVPSPLTLDHRWLEDSIERLELGMVEDGTAIGSAIAAAARRLDHREAKSKLIVLLTDGSNNSGELSPEVASELAKTLGIRIYCIAVGTPGRHAIHNPRTGRVVATMQSEYDSDTLMEVARIGEGAFFRAQDTTSLGKIFEKIDALEKTEMIRSRVVEAEELFPWFVGAGLALGMLGVASGDTLRRRSL